MYVCVTQYIGPVPPQWYSRGLIYTVGNSCIPWVNTVDNRFLYIPWITIRVPHGICYNQPTVYLMCSTVYAPRHIYIPWVNTVDYVYLYTVDNNTCTPRYILQSTHRISNVSHSIFSTVYGIYTVENVYIPCGLFCGYLVYTVGVFCGS